MSIFSNAINKAPREPAIYQPRIGELDGLRGIAIIVVVIFHYVNNQLVHSEYLLGKALYKITSFGWVGVDLFFVLSGFLIGSILIREKYSKKYFSTFYIRRIVRIVPNYYLFLILYSALLFTRVGSENSFIGGNTTIPLWSYFLMVHNLYMGHLDNMGYEALSITWSIGIEEQFYIFMPFIVYFTRRTILPFLLLCIIMIAPFLRITYNTWVPTYVLPTSRMDSLAFGVLVAWAHFQYNLKAIVQKNLLLLVSAFFVTVLLCAFFFVRYGDLGTIKHSLFGIIFSLLVVFALTYTNSWYAKFLQNPVLRLIGTISYSLYLFHYLILGLAHYIISKKTNIGIANITDVGVTIFALACSFLFAWFVYKKLEIPMVNFGKKFKYI